MKIFKMLKTYYISLYRANFKYQKFKMSHFEFYLLSRLKIKLILFGVNILNFAIFYYGGKFLKLNYQVNTLWIKRFNKYNFLKIKVSKMPTTGFHITYNKNSRVAFELQIAILGLYLFFLHKKTPHKRRRV